LIQKPRILIVDDFQPWARMLKSIVEEEQLGHVIGIVSEAYVALTKAEELKPDLVLLDISLPNMNGIDLANILKRIQPQPLILFISHYEAPSIIKAAIDSGGNGYILKTHLRQDLTLAIKTVCQGQRFLSAKAEDLMKKG
jgi:DNA-binding NarL/FixJ family response regulator